MATLTPRIEVREAPPIIRSGRVMKPTIVSSGYVVDQEEGPLARLTDGLDRASGLEERLDVLHDFLQSLGWKQFVYGWSSGPLGGQCGNVPVLVRAFPTNWDREWDRHSRHDPYFLSAANSRRPVRWSDVQNSTDLLTAPQRDCMHYISDLGLTDGITVPVHVHGRRFAFLTALGTECSAQDACRQEMTALLTMVAHYFHNHLWATTEQMVAGQIALSPREHQCLVWSAYGKTIEDIAAILDISAETVRVYLKRINQKLAAANRTHAVAKALHMGLISLN